MKQLIKKINFYFDYYIGYFMYTGCTKWSKYMIEKYPEEFPREVEYLKQLKKAN